MTIKEIEQLIDSKLNPIKKDLENIRNGIHDLVPEFRHIDERLSNLNVKLERIDNNITEFMNFMNYEKRGLSHDDEQVINQFLLNDRFEKTIKFRIEVLSKLEDGWHDGEGLAPDRKKLEILGDKIINYFNPELPLPAIFPTDEGNVQLEWSIANEEISVFVNLETLLGEYLQVNVVTNKVTEKLFDLYETDGWYDLNVILIKKSGE